MSGIGMLGELEVIEHYKRKGYEIYTPIRDNGIDLIMEKNNVFLQLQIKTSLYQRKKYFWFDIYKSKMRYGKNIFYVFVCKCLDRRKFMGKKENFLILNSLDLKKMLTNGEIPPQAKKKDVHSLFIYPEQNENKWYFRGKGKIIDFTKFLNIDL